MLLIGKMYQEEKQKLYDLQNGMCCICQRELSRDVQQNHLDHDHALTGPQAGRVRGLLCNLCNGLEGVMKHKFNRSGLVARDIDYITWMKDLIKYLETDNSQQAIHPQLVKDQTKRFTRLSKDDMILEMSEHGFEVKTWESKAQIAKSFQKQYKAKLKDL